MTVTPTASISAAKRYVTIHMIWMATMLSLGITKMACRHTSKGRNTVRVSKRIRSLRKSVMFVICCAILVYVTISNVKYTTQNKKFATVMVTGYVQ
mmetsp:Transcript_13992/g.29369  ORF Transcript_13992/g.29369 Transcript_13992/m.29369 type:complete len:96 (-) Transcript_13992:732-1019(-)